MNAKFPELKNQTLKIEWIPGTDPLMDRLEAVSYTHLTLPTSDLV